MSTIEKRAMDFWFEFDDFFSQPPRGHATGDILAAERHCFGLMSLFESNLADGTLYTEFKTELNSPGTESESRRNAIRLISDNHIKILNKYFGNDARSEQRAFEFFGEGSLFDDGISPNGQPRRQPDQKMHMMDGQIGMYRMWHSFIRSVMILGFSGDSNRWLQLDRHVALAAEIDTIVDPKQSDDPLGEDPRIRHPTANRIDPTTLNELRAKWLTKNVDQIDSEIIGLRDTEQ
jgi:hypothetical protein